MTIKRMVLIVTCVVVAALGWFFAASQWETASRAATLASALAGVAAVGVAIWAALLGSGQAGIAVQNSGAAKTAGKGNAVTGVSVSSSSGPVTVEGTGNAEATGEGDAISGFSEKK